MAREFEGLQAKFNPECLLLISRMDDLLAEVIPSWKPASEGQSSDWQLASGEQIGNISLAQKSLFHEIKEDRQASYPIKRDEFVRQLPMLDRGDVRVLTWEILQILSAESERLASVGLEGLSVKEIVDIYEEAEGRINHVHDLAKRQGADVHPHHFFIYRALSNLIHDGLGSLDTLQTVLDEYESLNDEKKRERVWRIAEKTFKSTVIEEGLNKYIRRVEEVVVTGQDGSLSLVSVPRGVEYLFSRAVEPNMLAYENISWPRVRRVAFSIEGECSLMLSRFEMFNMFKNLLKNSAVHSGKPKGELATLLWMGISEDERIKIIFIDNGKGFDKSMLRLNSDGKPMALNRGESTGGTGIGLWSIDQYVTGMGGKVELYNAKDLGFDMLGAMTVIDFPVYKK